MNDQPNQSEIKPLVRAGEVAGGLLVALWGESLEPNPAARWFVLHTQPRQEKALAESLEAMSIRHFLPLVRRVKYYAHRQRQTHVPLFSGYLFAWGDKECGYRAMATKRVAGIIPVADQARLEHELLQVRRALVDGVALEPCRYLQVGRRCRVSAGPLLGVEGLIESLPQPNRVVLQIHALGQAVSAQVDPGLVEVLD